jgi:hypothetical protein
MSIDEWLKNNGFGQYAESFIRNHIDLAMLPGLTDADLQTLGVVSLGHRKRILAACMVPAVMVPVPPTGAEPPCIDLAQLPFPIAHPLSYTRGPGLTPSEQLDNVLFAAYQALRMTALLLLADYLETDSVSPRLVKPIGGLRMPHWGEWINLCSELVKFWSSPTSGSADRPERPTYFPELVAGWRSLTKDQMTWAPLLAGLPGLQGPAKQVFDALQKLRNDRRHREGVITPDATKDAERLPQVLMLVEQLAMVLFPPGGFVLWRRLGNRQDPPREVFSLQGPHVDLKFSPRRSPRHGPAPLPSPTWWPRPKQSRYRSIHSLFPWTPIPLHTP